MQCISANAIFGYKKSAKDIHKLEIDDETAFIVEMIFDYALTGKNSIQIAKMLNEQQIKTPAWYKNKCDRRSYEVDSKTIWTSAKVMKIIRDQRYAGDMVGNVRATTKVAKNDNIRVDRKEWIIVENTHKGIVSKEIFRKVNEEIMPIKERSNVAVGESRRQGFCYCAYCGRLLQKENNPVNPYLFCVRQKYDVKNGCDEMKIMTIPLQATLSAMVVKYVSSLIELQTFVKRSKMKIFQNHKSAMTGDEIEKEILKLKQSTISLNQRYHEGRFTKEAYILQKDKIRIQIEELEDKKLQILNGIGDKEAQKEWEKELEEKIEKFKDRISFTESELAEVISRVDVYSQTEIRVKWRFMDFTAKATDYLVRAQKIAC
ncbi:recombinase [Lachnotalea glycerini]|uniref:Recombinase n=1 Tax=Lachnotalea glycerini TaxID=1763509 RepID=A0A318EPI5_9FIRM|nr:recombinase family protein [Lachnotalea glycerini]PXV93381.1 recombinase [Lachnotalea glycerini]